MTSKLLSILWLITLLSLASCSGNRETTENSQPTSERAKKAEANEEENIESVVNEYLSIKNALVASDAETAKAGAVKLLELVDATSMPDLQQQTKEMAAVDNLSSLRTQFDSLSVALYDQVKARPDSSRTLYKQYCPMAFNNRGAFWLSNEEEIKNPYFGEEMLTCGQVEEKITF